MTGVNGWYSANQRSPTGIESVGTKPLPRNGRNTRGCGRLLATRPKATHSQVSAKVISARTAAAATHSSGLALVRNPMSTATAVRTAAPQRLDAAVAWDLQGERLVVAHRLTEHAGCRLEAVRVGELQADVAAGDAALELVRGALGDQAAAVEQGDTVGELVGLLQVLGGQEDGDPAGHQLADELPHAAAAAGVQAGGRLVQEASMRAAGFRVVSGTRAEAGR
jgi:hypothetical protein